MIINPSQAAQTIALTNYDVIIFGATWGGINAAVTASISGKRVAVIEPTGYIGGHAAQSGINLLDITYTNQLGGIVWQQVQEMAQAMGNAVTGAPTLISRSSASSGNANYFPAIYDAPSARVVESVLTGWLLRSGADVFLNCPLSTTAGSLVGSVNMNGTNITSISTFLGVFTGKTFIDASYEGDIMALSGCSYTIGRESSSTLTPTITAGYNACANIGYGESLAGVQASPPTQTFTGATFVDGNGVPLFPLLPNPNLTAGAGDARIQAYSYRTKLCLISNGTATAFTPPAGYNASDYAVTAAIANNISATTLSQLVTLTALSNNQIDVNAQNAVSNDLANGSTNYPESTPSQRAVIIAAHQKWCKGLLYFLANDSSVPSAVRTNASLYGYDSREWTDNGNFPRQIYIREARRMIGQYVLTQNDFYTTTTKTDSIAKTSYNIDCHGPNVYLSGLYSIVRDGDLFVTLPSGPIQFPLRSILPNPTQATNLIVVGAPSVSHVAWAPTRMEMQIGQWGEAAGLLAALAGNNLTTVQNVPYSSLASELSNIGALTT